MEQLHKQVIESGSTRLIEGYKTPQNGLKQAKDEVEKMIKIVRASKENMQDRWSCFLNCLIIQNRSLGTCDNIALRWMLEPH